MTADSKLYPAKIRSQCSSAIEIFRRDSSNLQATKEKIKAFVDDNKIESVAFDQLKEQCRNYLDVIDLMAEANDQDIADYKTLSAAVGEEDLIGSVIFTLQKYYMRKRNEALERQRYYESRAYDPLNGPYMRQLAQGYAEMVQMYYENYLIYVKKEEKYDAIEAETGSLFANGIAVRGAIENLLGRIKLSFSLNTGYLPGMIEVSKMQADCIARGDMDTANGIRCLEEYMIQSGDFTAEQRVAVLSKMLEMMPDKLRLLPNDISMVGQGMDTSKIEKWKIDYLSHWMEENKTEVLSAIEVERWGKVVHEVGQAYADQIKTYCGRTKDEPGYGACDQRKLYVLEGIDGNLSGYKVGDRRRDADGGEDNGRSCADRGDDNGRKREKRFKVCCWSVW